MGAASARVSAIAIKSKLQQFLLDESVQQLSCISADALARRSESLRQIINYSRKGQSTSAAFEDFSGNRIGLEQALWRKQYPATVRRIMCKPNWLARKVYAAFASLAQLAVCQQCCKLVRSYTDETWAQCPKKPKHKPDYLRHICSRVWELLAKRTLPRIYS